MNKESPEYKRVMDDINAIEFDLIKRIAMGERVYKADLAGQILAIKGIAIEADDQSLPELYKEQFSRGMLLPTDNDMEDYAKAVGWLQNDANFRRVI